MEPGWPVLGEPQDGDSSEENNRYLKAKVECQFLSIEQRVNKLEDVQTQIEAVTRAALESKCGSHKALAGR